MSDAREKLLEVMAQAIYRAVDNAHRMGPAAFQMNGHIADEATAAALSALEAAGVRLVPVNEKPGQGWLHEAVKDACLRSVKNMSGREPPQLLYAPILWAMQDALAASPLRPQGDGQMSDVHPKWQSFIEGLSKLTDETGICIEGGIPYVMEDRIEWMNKYDTDADGKLIRTHCQARTIRLSTVDALKQLAASPYAPAQKAETND